MRAIIAAAGTGGHINPGIAIANKIIKEDENSKVIFIGTSRGLENDLVPRAGYELKQIDAYGFNRRLSFENIKKFIKTIKSSKEAKNIIEEFNPDIIIGTGGYITAVVGRTAKKCGIPVILHESNAFPGMSVKYLEKQADTILVGFEDAKKRLSRADNVVVTGTPTKIKGRDLKIEDIREILSQFNFETERPVVLAFGGSQGAKSINDALVNIIKNNKNTKYNIIWATGKDGYEEIKSTFEENGLDIFNLKNARVVPYIYNMEDILNAVDLVVSRSGAMTITEISNVGKPSIFIPFPFATENHQEYNAKVLADRGAARIILDKDLNFENLNLEIEDMLSDPQRLYWMGQKAKENAIENVEQKIYDEIIKVAKK